MDEIQYNERTGLPEYYNQYTGQWEGFSGETPPEQVSYSRFSLDDIKNRSGYTLTPMGEFVSDVKNEALDPSEYYKQLASELAKQSYGLSSWNQDASEYNNLIEGLKEVDPKAYYQAKIDLLGRGVGHNVQSNEGGRADIVKKQLEAFIPEAQKAGLTPEEIQSTYGSGYSSGRQGFSNILGIQQQEQKGFLAPLIEGAKFVGPGLLGMYGIDAALTAGLGAGYGAATGLSSTGIGSGLGTAAELSGALTSGAGSLGSGALGAGAIASEAGQAAFFDALANGATSTEALNAGLSLEALASNTAPYVTSELAGPTYGELGYTGVEGGFAGPTYAEMGYTGLNQGEAIAAADAAAKGMSTSDILSNANRIRSGANTLAKLVRSPSGATSGTTGGLTGGTTGGTGVNTQQLASLLSLPTQVAPGGIYRMNQNPFTFGTQGQTPVSQGTYDVSGTNPMANALRKA